MNESNQPGRFLTVKRLVEVYGPQCGWPHSEAALRHQIKHAKANGLSKALCHVGKRLLINEIAYLDWIKGRNALAGEG